ncbi:1-phosphatidylinositol 4,5-bisphosphate phosphodiesterase beta-4-like isoform X2 [Bolinopsis microptera]|uniref:1-phosphatidylinositol 4,5-bisphosphate phosphodiesterase beta-4-like isoform X2 n=1 Tax=Bolinopsis microptera TaxID=2820187 RepID=UPI003079F05D
MEGNVIDVAHIVDIRTDKCPKDPKTIENFKHVGDSDDPLNERCFQIVTADQKFTENQFYNFMAFTKEDCKAFAADLFSICHHFLNINLSQMDFVRKMHKRILLSSKDDKNVSMKEIIKVTAKDEKKKVVEALKTAGLKPTDRKNDQLSKDKFTFENFYKFYKEMLGDRPEVAKVFDEIKAGNRRNYISVDQIVDFLNKFQRDPRLNEILFPHHNKDGTKRLIHMYEGDKSKQKIGQLTLEGFTNFLMSPDNLPTNILNLPVYQSMDQPISHYFINSSHNTYLTGDQFSGKSSVEIYRQVLLSGCRCIELDCWDGEDNEPQITHGFTLCSSIQFKDVILAINETAFKTSPYPLILSFENHCTPRQQQKMAKYCMDIFGDKLLREPLDDPKAQLKPGCMLPSPEMLKYKILVKNKKRKEDMPDQMEKDEEIVVKKEEEVAPALSGTGIYLDGVEPPKEGEDEENNKGSWEDREEEAETSLSKLVNYIMPAPKFRGFDQAAKKNVSYEMSSFVETAALNHLKENPVEFVNYNKRQVSRIYPKGARVASDNYQPQMFWNTGCQMVALNFQTLDMPMQLNIGKFEFNNKTGYLLKPDFMTKTQTTFNPFLEMSVEGVVAAELKVHVLSGQFLSDKKCGVKVELEMYGIANDSVRRKHQTKTINNSICPRWDNEDPFVFAKIVIPDLAMMRFIVNDDAGKMIGQRIIPMESIQSGYRFISLRNDFNIPIGMASLFVKIDVKDYIPSEMADFANALVDPIAHLSKDDLMKRREDMLTTLVDQEDLIDPEAVAAAEAKALDAAKPASAQTTNNRRNRRVRGRDNPNAAPVASAPAPPKQAAIVITGLETFTNVQPKAGAVPDKNPKPKEEFVGGLYVGDDSAKLVTDDKAGKPKSTAPVLPWDLPVDDVPADDERMLPKIQGVDWNEITEESIKKGKAWLKYYSKQDKKNQDIQKNQEKEKQMLQKSQKGQMDKLLKENQVLRANQIKAQEKARKPGFGRKAFCVSVTDPALSKGLDFNCKDDTKEQFDAFIKKHDEKQAKEVNNLTLQHKSEAFRVEKIHKSEKFTHDRKEMKENHEMYKKIKKEAHEAQFAGFELYQRNELADQMKVIEGKKADQLAKLIAEVKDKDELAEKKRQLDERCEREINNQSNKLAKNQEIRREQVVAEHKEQMKLMGQVYLKRIKEFDEDTQSEIERLENEIQAIGFIEQ